MKKIILGVLVLLGLSATVALADTTLTFKTARNNTSTIAQAAAALGETPEQFATFNPNAKLASGQTFSTTTVTVTPPPPPPGNEVVLTNVYTTAYGWPDNTPAGNQTHICSTSPCAWNSAPAGSAGGDGTYANPITLATGVQHVGSNEVDDYQAGTIFYSPNLRKYFVVGDICGDGNSPQNGPCHKSEIAGTIQLDMWVGGQGAKKSSVLSCEDAVTRVGTLIENPASNYVVVSGPIYNNGCAQQFGDTAITQ